MTHSSTVLKAVFETTEGVIENAGTGFLLEAPSHGTVFVTALHVFGPPGGLPEWIPSADLSVIVESATLADAFSQQGVGRVVGTVRTPEARLPTEEGGEPGLDFAVFEIDDPSRRGLEPALGPDPELWIVSPGLPNGMALPVVRLEGPSHFVSVAIPEDLTLPVGISGSPIVTAQGDVVGLVVMLGEGPDGERAIHGTPIEVVLRGLGG